MARPKPEEKPVNTVVRWPPALLERLKIHADVEGKSVNQAVLDLVDRALQVRGL